MFRLVRTLLSAFAERLKSIAGGSTWDDNGRKNAPPKYPVKRGGEVEKRLRLARK